MVVTCHYIDDEWRVQKKIIRFCVVNTPVGTLRQGCPLLQDKDEGAQERQLRTTGPDPRGQVPNLRGPDLGLYKWKPDLQEA